VYYDGKCLNPYGDPYSMPETGPPPAFKVWPENESGAGFWRIGGNHKYSGANNKWVGQIDDFRVTKAARYTGDFSDSLPGPAPAEGPPPVCGNGNLEDGEPCDVGHTDEGAVCAEDCSAQYDPDWDNVVLLLPFDEDYGDVSQSGHSFTPDTSNPGATVAVHSEGDQRFGTGALSIAGGGHLRAPGSADFNFGGGDFTVEWWHKNGIPGAQTAQHILSYSNDSQGWYWAAGLNTTSWRLMFWGTDDPFYDVNPANEGQPADMDGQWHHLAVVRSGDEIRFFVDGIYGRNETHKGSRLRTGSLADYLGDLLIGTWTPNSFYLTGLMDDVRITREVVRYWDDFTPLTRPFPASGP
jgi:hypothetical protein